MRPSSRALDELRDIQIQRQYTRYAEGSVLVSFGNTKVLCNASVETHVPKFLKGTGQGWVTAEYSMLPRATHDRNMREASRGKQSGRTLEIQRLIGRSLRAAVDMRAFGENSITIDCDVIQADGGTRTAAITGGCVALYDALQTMMNKGKLITNPFKSFIAAISVGIYKGQAVLDLDYDEDSSADTDMNVVMNERQGFIEVQGTAENGAFSRDQFNALMELAEVGTTRLIQAQKDAINA